MAVTESFKIMASLWLFVRAFVRAIVLYINENKSPKQAQLKGKGLGKEVMLPDKLPSIVEIKRALPRHCFDPKVSTSMYYAAKDIIQVAVCYAVFSLIHTTFPITYWPTMIFYWAIQGTFFTAIFVCGHDCGHESFSHHTALNDVMGNILHSFLLVPFYMWKISHKHHHKFTGNIDKDEVFYPLKTDEPSSKHYLLPGFGFGFGWFYYLGFGYSPRNVAHYVYNHPMFSKYKLQCTVSILCDALMVYFIYLFYQSQGFINLFTYYLVPVFLFASYTVVITFLHHTEMNIPWYTDEKWDFVRGQLSTIDRHYGIVHSILHNIGTHQMHHMFLKIPHYYLEDATVNFRATFPDLVRICDEPILPSFFRMFKIFDSQKSIPNDTKIHYFHEYSRADQEHAHEN